MDLSRTNADDANRPLRLCEAFAQPITACFLSSPFSESHTITVLIAHTLTEFYADVGRTKAIDERTRCERFVCRTPGRSFELAEVDLRVGA